LLLVSCLSQTFKCVAIKYQARQEPSPLAVLTIAPIALRFVPIRDYKPNCRTNLA